MRINLLLDNEKDLLSGYINVDPFLIQNSENRASHNVTNLDGLVCDNEATEIIAKDILDYYPINKVPEVVCHWIKKLAHKGTIIIESIDIEEVSRGVVFGNIKLEDANKLLYGKQEKQWQNKKHCLSLGQAVDFLQSQGMKIIKKRNNNFRFNIVAERP